MGAPAGHPYAHPEGVCINGLGALPSPYGPTLRGAHNGPSGLQKIKSKHASLRVCWGYRSWWGNLGQKQRELGVNVRLNVTCAKWNREKNLAKIMSKLTERRIWPKLCQTTNCWYFLVNYIIVWPTCIKLYLDCLWANLSGWIMRLIKIQYPFLEKIPLCRERKSCGIEHTEFIEVVNLFISSFICNLEFIS